MGKSVSDTKKSSKSDVNVSCWNCFIVENDNDYEKEVPLSEVRKDYRTHFKLYSIMASEISRPKAVSIKHKMKENYNVSKSIEKKLLNNTSSETTTIKIQEDNNLNIEFPVNNEEKELQIQKIENTCPKINDTQDVSTLSQSQVINIEEDPKDASILYKVHIETSTPKFFKNTKDAECNYCPCVPENETPRKKDEDTLTNVQSNLNLDKTDSAAITAKSENSSCNNSESGYAGSSLRDLTDIEFVNNNLPEKTLSNDCSKSYTEIKEQFNCDTFDFKTSLPALNITQKRNILKSAKSLCGTSNTETRPVKSLRWSTLDLPHKSTSINDEVYLPDAASPNHATLPRRSNSPLPHERDLDRDRFSLNRSGLQARSESMASVYSGAGEGTRGNVTVRGEVQISLLYNYRLGALEVGVKRCRELAPVDIKRNRSDPYVKVYLLPDKSKAGKRKTKVKKNTLNPVFEETLSFVQPLASLSARTLWLSVWHADMFGRNDFLGEVTLPLADVVFDDPAPMWHKLHERTEQFDEQQGSRGDLIVALKLDLHEGTRGKGTLHVLVKEAKNLVATKPNGLADVFCKSYLLPERGRLAKQKTPVCRRTLSPKWEHTFTYRGLSLQELNARALELSLWDRDRLASNDFMGAIRLSLGTGTYMGAPVNWMDSVGKEVSLWQMMMQRPNFWVEGSFPLRPHLNN